MLKRIALLLLAVLSASTAFAQIPQWPDTGNQGVASFIVFGLYDTNGQIVWGGENCTYPIPYLYRYNFGWSVACTNAFRAVRPDWQYANYTDGSQSGSGALNLAWFQNNHPEWLLWRCDQNTILSAYNYFAPIPDFADTGWRDYKQTNVWNAVALGSPIVGFDNSLLTNEFFPNYPDGIYGNACGKYPNAAPGNIQAAPWQAMYSGVPTQATYMSAFLAYLADLKSRTNAMTPPRLSMPNTDPKVVYGIPALRTALMAAVDGTLTEGGNYGPEWPGTSQHYWLGQLNFALDMQAAGKAVYVVQSAYQMNTNTMLTTQGGKEWQEFSVASYLLAKNHYSSIGLQPCKGNADPALNDCKTDNLQWSAVMENANNIGTPCAAFSQVVGSLPETGLYYREFTKGAVLVNPTFDETNSYTLPTNNWTWTDLYGTTVTAARTLGPITLTNGGLPIAGAYGRIYLKVSSDGNPTSCSNGAPDVTPPPITAGPSATSITQTSATIEWTTEEVADSQVAYGTTTGYGLITTLDTNQTLSHSVALPGASNPALVAGTTYHYSVLSRDPSGNLTASVDQTFTTSANSTILVTTATPLPSGVVGTAYSQTLTASGGTLTGTGYQYRKTQTLDTAAGASDLTDYPFFLYRTNPEWATTANAGHVQNAMGYDLASFSAAGATGLMDFEREIYTATTGEYGSWTRVPTLSHTTTTPVYVGYGNGSISSSQANPSGVWGSAYKAVFHMSDLSDSSASNCPLTTSANAPTLGAGKLINGYTFTTGNFLTTSCNSAALVVTGSLTVCLWVKFSTTQTSIIFLQGDGETYGMSVGDIFAGGSTNKFMFWATKSMAVKKATSALTYNDNSWHYVCGQYNGSNVIIDVDGGADRVTGTAVTGTLDSPSPSTTNNIKFGQTLYNGLANGWFIGSLDEFTLENRANTASWIATAYSNQNDPANFATDGTEASIGGTGVYTWAVTVGTLPTGLSLSGAIISGTPSVAGTSSFTIRATDSVAATNSKDVSIAIQPAVTLTTNLTLPPAIINGVYSTSIAPADGIPPYQFNVASGALPDGLTVNFSGIVGLPTALGSFAFNVCATDSAIPTPSETCRDYQIIVNYGGAGTGRRLGPR